MEKRGYRENLELISAAYPQRMALTIDEVARFCGVSRMTIMRWKDGGKLGVVQEGPHKKVLIPVQSVARYLAG